VNNGRFMFEKKNCYINANDTPLAQGLIKIDGSGENHLGWEHRLHSHNVFGSEIT
jgi:hypothetical protein